MSRTLTVLKQRIKESGLTMREIGAGSGVPPSSICRFINDQGSLSMKSYEKLVQFFDNLDRKKARDARKSKPQPEKEIA